MLETLSLTASCFHLIPVFRNLWSNSLVFALTFTHTLSFWQVNQLPLNRCIAFDAIEQTMPICKKRGSKPTPR